MSTKRVFVSVILSFSLFIQGCVKEDLTKLSDTLDWQPNFSLPVATVVINSGDYAGSLSFLDSYNLTKEILISKTIDFNFTDIFSQEEYVEKLMFRFDIKNKFPARLEAYAYYLDNNLQIVKSVLTDPPIHIPASQVDDEGNIINESQVIHDEYFGKEDIPLLTSVKYVLIQMYIKELDQREMILSQIDNYEIELGVGIRAYLNIPVK